MFVATEVYPAAGKISVKSLQHSAVIHCISDHLEWLPVNGLLIHFAHRLRFSSCLRKIDLAVTEACHKGENNFLQKLDPDFLLMVCRYFARIFNSLRVIRLPINGLTATTLTSYHTQVTIFLAATVTLLRRGENYSIWKRDRYFILMICLLSDTFQASLTVRDFKPAIYVRHTIRNVTWRHRPEITSSFDCQTMASYKCSIAYMSTWRLWSLSLFWFRLGRQRAC